MFPETVSRRCTVFPMALYSTPSLIAIGVQLELRGQLSLGSGCRGFAEGGPGRYRVPKGYLAEGGEFLSHEGGPGLFFSTTDFF